MATPVIIPKLGNTVEECLIGQWRINIGSEVKRGDILLDIETDKSTFEIEAPADGTLLTIFFAEGDLAPVLINIAVIGKPGDDVKPFEPVLNKSVSQTDGKKSPAAVLPQKQIPASSVNNKDKTAAADNRLNTFNLTLPTGGVSPRAKNLIKKYGLNASSISGSGPNGRITEKDVINAYQNQPRFSRLARELVSNGWSAKGPGRGLNKMILSTDLRKPGIKLAGIRAKIASHMKTSLGNTAQYTECLSINATDLLKLRKKIKQAQNHNTMADINLNHLIMFASVKTLQQFPQLNAELIDNHVYQHDEINLGFACHTEKGLIVPVVKNAEKLTLSELAIRTRELAEQAAASRISPDDLQGGTFTISNLGSMGIEYFTPIINYPQVAVLGVGCIEPKPVRNGDMIDFFDSLKLSLTADHQVIDGTPAASFLLKLKENLENFSDIFTINTIFVQDLVNENK